MTSLLPTKRYSSLLLASLLILFGCSLTPKPNLTQFNTCQEALYPPITVVMTSSDFQHSRNRDAFLSALEEANIFESISNTNTDFVMEVNLDIKNTMEDNAGGYAKAAIWGLTMGLVPLSMEFVIKGTIKLKYQGVIFEELDVESHYKRIGNLFSFDNRDESIEGAYRKVVEEIIEEIMERNSFDKLFNKLQEQEESETI